MKSRLTLLCTLLMILFSPLAASATPTLTDWGFYIDGQSSYYDWGWGDQLTDVPGLDSSSFNGETGTLSWNTSVAGDHSVIAFFDFEMSYLNNSYFNEYGTAVGTPAAGQSWEIDEPGYWGGSLIPNAIGLNLDTYEYTEQVGLENSNDVPEGWEDDVAFAIGWDFTLLEDEEATIEFILSDLLPDSFFYLIHSDPDSLNGMGESLYFASTLDITATGTQPAPVPEPATLLLLGVGLSGLGCVTRKHQRKRDK